MLFKAEIALKKKYYARYASYWAKCQLTKMYVNLAKIGLSPSESVNMSLIKVSVMNVQVVILTLLSCDDLT